MNLFLHILAHFLLSFLAGYIAWKIFKKPFPAFFSAVIFGVFVDLDHLIDYFSAFGCNFNLSYFLSGYQFLKAGKIYILFHGWEYAIILIAFAFAVKNKILKTSLFAAGISLFLHFGFDVIHNEIPARSYFISYRISKNFEVEELVTADHYKEIIVKKRRVGFD